MTPAERQRRRRKLLVSKQSAAVAKALRAKARQKAAEKYIPAPPGITYWEKVEVTLPSGEHKVIYTPTTKPLAACETMLDDDDVIALVRRLGSVATERGIIDAALSALRAGSGTAGIMIS